MTDRREYMREYYRRHKAERNAYMRKYRALRKQRETGEDTDEARRQRKRDYNREYSRQYREAHREKISAEKREYYQRKRGIGISAGNVVPLRSIQAAKVKPKGVSDVRWRIELSRRRMVAKEKAGGGIGNLSTLPHPDRLW